MEACVIRPGQLWTWTLDYGNVGGWPLMVVNDLSRVVCINTCTIIKRGDTFLVVSLDDDGPALPVFLDIDPASNGVQVPTFVNRLNHVILLHGQLVWLEGASFSCAKLLEDA